jgi:hypothetical protein
MKATLLTLFTFAATFLFAQTNYHKNSHVKHESFQYGEHYRVAFTFKDQFGKIRNFKLQYPKAKTDVMTERFGVPKKIYESSANTWKAKTQKDNWLEQGLFRNYLDSGKSFVSADPHRCVSFYAQVYCRPIASLIIQILKRENKDTRTERIRMAMKFTQDMPYAIPTSYVGEKYVHGINPIPSILTEGYGDCDSKAFMYAGILCYLISPEDIAFVGIPKHLLCAVVMPIEEREQYPIGFELRGKYYALTETAGPGRSDIGQKGEVYDGVHNVERLRFNPAEGNKWQKREYKSEYDMKKGQVLFVNSGADFLKINLSFDREHWQWIKVPSGGKLPVKIGNFPEVYLQFNGQKRTVKNGLSYEFKQEGANWICYEVE